MSVFKTIVALLQIYLTKSSHATGRSLHCVGADISSHLSRKVTFVSYLDKFSSTSTRPYHQRIQPPLYRLQDKKISTQTVHQILNKVAECSTSIHCYNDFEIFRFNFSFRYSMWRVAKHELSRINKDDDESAICQRFRVCKHFDFLHKNENS